MRHASILGAALLALASTSARAADAPAPGHAFDGRWSVTLVCPDTQDKNGLVKGYTYTFDVTIDGGKLRGQYGARNAPASIVYYGDVADDGSLQIKAIGNTGRSEYAVGRMPQGTPYSYTLTGKLEGDRGQAVRRELRPCTASLGRT